jgi:hypothetical protein
MIVVIQWERAEVQHDSFSFQPEMVAAGRPASPSCATSMAALQPLLMQSKDAAWLYPAARGPYLPRPKAIMCIAFPQKDEP